MTSSRDYQVTIVVRLFSLIALTTGFIIFLDQIITQYCLIYENILVTIFTFRGNFAFLRTLSLLSRIGVPVLYARCSRMTYFEC